MLLQLVGGDIPDQSIKPVTSSERLLKGRYRLVVQDGMAVGLLVSWMPSVLMDRVLEQSQLVWLKAEPGAHRLVMFPWPITYSR